MIKIFSIAYENISKSSILSYLMKYNHSGFGKLNNTFGVYQPIGDFTGDGPTAHI